MHKYGLHHLHLWYSLDKRVGVAESPPPEEEPTVSVLVLPVSVVEVVVVLLPLETESVVVCSLSIIPHPIVSEAAMMVASMAFIVILL